METSSPKNSSFSPTPFVVAGYVVLALTFGVFGSWAAIAPLASGVVAGGVVSVFSDRKVIQHLEGGIIEEIYVKEGDLVEVDDILIKLDDKQSRANYTILQSRLDLILATEARLQAESLDAETIEFPEEVLSRVEEDGEEAQFIALQKQLFKDRKTTKQGQIDILTARIGQLEEELLGLDAQKSAFSEQAESLRAEKERLEGGQKNGFIATNQVAQLSRNLMGLMGDIGRATANSAKVKQTISETRLQILQIDQEFMERASSELRDIRDQKNETTERVKQAEDIMMRTTIRSPVRGMVQGIQTNTATGVIRPAQPIMDVIPLDEDLIINARVQPVDIDIVTIGGRAEVRFPAFSMRTTPVIFGNVQVISQDVVQPDNPQQEAYYLARIEVPEADVPEVIKGRLMPGMPAEVIVLAGDRTLVDYLIKPIKDGFSKGLLEQ